MKDFDGTKMHGATTKKKTIFKIQLHCYYTKILAIWVQSRMIGREYVAAFVVFE